MNIHAAQLMFNRENNVSIAKAMFNYFLAQYADSISRKVVAEADVAAMRAANTEYQKHDDAIGFGGRPPWNDLQIKHKEQQLAYIAEEVKDAESIIKFMRDRFLFGMI
jgi:hypothetical protein